MSTYSASRQVEALRAVLIRSDEFTVDVGSLYAAIAASLGRLGDMAALEAAVSLAVTTVFSARPSTIGQDAQR